ncbi:caspase family protein [Streptomyces sp. NPDC059866]|uniref:caspase family protein n=1 Tax=Streptomyces sp. NPDC059866 TaxID=3346978 RepID=UPI00365054D0
MTALPRGALPQNTFAVLVGVEEYESSSFPTLKGAAADALRHAEWLRRSGVPPAQIRLCVSPDHSPDVQNAARSLGLTVRPAHQADVEGLLKTELPQWEGDLLWLAWSGHGVTDPRTRELLLPFGDGTDYAEQTLAATSLQDTLLHHPHYQRIPKKIFFIDTCRLHERVAEHYGVLKLPAAPHATTDTRLSVLYATQDDDYAANGRLGFTQALLDELNGTPSPWPPDVDTLATTVQKRLERTGAGTQRLQLHVRNWQGHRRDYEIGDRRDRPAWLRTHAKMLTRLDSSYHNDHLPYVTPQGAAHRPETLLARLEKNIDPDTGLLLVGVAGAGKTRTCLEVAGLAATRRWTVLHVSPDTDLTEPVLTEQIRHEIDHRPGRPLLLVLDYLDRYNQLDLKELAAGLRGETGAGARVACLAAVRPGALQSVLDRGSADLFTPIDIDKDEQHQKNITQAIFTSFAKEPLDTWGFDEMADICTTRPGMARLLAIAVDKRFQQMKTNGDDVSSPPASIPRDGLVGWLRRRTQEDLPADGPDRTLLHAATVTALSCPHPRPTVEQTVDRYLAHHAPGDRAADTLAELEAIGWLRHDTDDTVDLVHDSVTDAFLDRACRSPRSTLDSSALRAFLDALLGNLHTYRQSIAHLGRFAADLPEHDHLAHRLPSECATWLRERKQTVLTTLLTEPREGLRTLVAMVSAPPWRQAVIDTWTDLAQPWIDATTPTDPAAVRILLIDAVRNRPGPLPDVLLDAARTWLDQHTTTDINSLALITALLRSPGLHHHNPAHHTHRTHLEERAQTWLRQYGRRRDGLARHPLQALLRAPECGPAVLRPAATTALALVSRTPRKRENEWLLSALLRSHHLPDEAWPRLAETTRTWLAEHVPLRSATYVIDRALEQPAIPTPKAQQIADLALTWLTHNKEDEAADFVLSALLKREGLTDPTVRQAITHIHAWPTWRKTALRASFVLAPLLHESCVRTAPDLTPTSVDLALQWLTEHETKPQAGFVLAPLLRQRDAATHDQDAATVKQLAINAALRWLDPDRPWDRRLIGSLLAQGPHMSPDQRNKAAAAAVHRMQAGLQDTAADTDQHTRPGTHLDDSFVHRELLEMQGLPPGLQNPAFTHALTWLDLHGDEARATFVIAPLLYRTAACHAGPQLSAAADHALRWLHTHAPAKEADYVLRNLLVAPATPAGDLEPHTVAHRTLDHALTWLAAHGSNSVIDCINGTATWGASVLGHVLDRKDDLTTDQATTLLDIITRHLGQHPRTPDTAHEENHLLRRLLRFPLTTPPAEARTTRWALDRLGPEPHLPGDDLTISALLRRLNRTGTHEPEAVRSALHWFATQPPKPEDCYLLSRLLEAPHLEPRERRTTEQHAANWLRDYGTTPEASFVLAGLLISARTTGTPDPHLVHAAHDWLTHHPDLESAPHVRAALDTDSPPQRPPSPDDHQELTSRS